MMLLDTLKFILTHPVSKGRRLAVMSDWLSWQIGSRLVPGAVSVPYVNDSLLLVEPGMTGATGNIYVGLAEFEDMAFLLHFLHEEDLFVDVGANIGSYTVLASKVVGARTIAFEPFPPTYNKLKGNIIINQIEQRVEIFNTALGDAEASISFTTDLDTMNHVIVGNSTESGESCVVPVKRLDDVLVDHVPRLIKIDVEGYETAVIGGASSTLRSSEQVAVILELNGCGRRFGFSDRSLHEAMLGLGYSACRYSPFDRTLSRRVKCERSIGNIIYVKEDGLDEVAKKLYKAKPFHVKGLAI